MLNTMLLCHYQRIKYREKSPLTKYEEAQRCDHDAHGTGDHQAETQIQSQFTQSDTCFNVEFPSDHEPKTHIKYTKKWFPFS